MSPRATRFAAVVGQCLLLIALWSRHGEARSTDYPKGSAHEVGFVGSKACYGCHASIYQSFKQTDMGRSLTPANSWKAMLPPQAALTQPRTGRIFEVFQAESAWRQRESEPGVFAVDHQLAYAVGSGANGLTFLIQRGHYLFQAPLSYYSKTKKWGFSPGYENADLGFTRAVPQECINCHAGRATPVPEVPSAFGDPPFQEEAIGCENCHGAGGAHVRSLGRQAGSIVNPAKLVPRLADNICMNCHQAGDARVLQPGKTFADFRPGQWLFDTAVILKQPAQSAAQQQESDLLEHYSAMQASRCFRSSAGKLGCLTCHDPHAQLRQPAEAAAFFRTKCLSCHTDQSCRLPLTTRQHQQPPDDCAACHMPKRDVAQVSHSALTNHRIPARPNEELPIVSAQQTGGLIVVNAPPDRTLELSPVTLLRAYAQLSAQNPDFQNRYSDLLDQLRRQNSPEPFVQAALGHQALSEDKPELAISYLQHGLQLNDASVNLEMGQALAKLARHQEAVEYLKRAAALVPFNAVVQKTLILEYINLKAYPEAREHMQRYVEDFPDDAFMRSLLARIAK